MALSFNDIANDIDKLSPMMQQYVNNKMARPDCILLFRLGDFYELFFDDAVLMSKELELTLTARDCGLSEKAPMAGVPYHSVDSYIDKLIEKNYKIAICEQMEDPALAKGIVKREIVKIITPGTVTDIHNIDESKNNYLSAIFKLGTAFAIANIDLTSGEFNGTEIIYGDSEIKLYNEVHRVAPAEIIVDSEFMDSGLAKVLKGENFYFSVIDSKYFTENNYDKFLPEESKVNSILDKAAQGLLSYIVDTQKSIPDHIGKLEIYQIQEFMEMSASARSSLEITETLRERKKKGSLLWVLDKTETAMGSRMLRKWLEQPLLDPNKINERLEAVELVKDSFILRQEIKEVLNGMHDLARLAGKLSMNQINPREMQALGQTLAKIPALKNLAEQIESNSFKRILDSINPLEEVVNVLDNALMEALPITIQDGNIIKTGFDDIVDENREIDEHGSEWILKLEQKEKETYGIKNLKVGYNRVFGYFIEVTKSNLSLVPEHYQRKQTLANSERYIIPELKEIEDKILGAKQRLQTREYEVFVELRSYLAQHLDSIKQNAESIAKLDVIVSFAEIAERNNYVRPVIAKDSVIKLEASRHPVVEKVLPKAEFVPNDANLGKDSEVVLLTGPNMSGKSTYMRQIALINIMAQIGSFVPAERAEIGITDQIFTRIGASDDLSSGQSTFMVEMNEVSYILNNASSRSLLILDEIGRGTSTYDGLAIAWAVLERVSNARLLGARTLFATHYHELTDLEKSIPNIKNYHVAVKKADKDSDIEFLHHIERGPTDQSYGVEVAKLAGLPKSVVNRAYEILYNLEKNSANKNTSRSKSSNEINGQIDIFSSSVEMQRNNEIMESLNNLDVQNMTPMEALQTLYKLSEDAKKM